MTVCWFIAQYKITQESPTTVQENFFVPSPNQVLFNAQVQRNDYIFM